MIETKEQLQYFLEYEKRLYGKKRKYIFLPRLSEKSIIWRYICLLRLEEYHFNAKHKIRSRLFKYLRLKMARKYCIQIPINVVDVGLKLFHVSPIMLNAKRIGKNCMIGPNVYMVAQGHTGENAIIGNDVSIGASVTIVGGVVIEDGIAIGANSLVNKSFSEKNITIAGNPARKISDNSSYTWGGRKIYKNI